MKIPELKEQILPLQQALGRIGLALLASLQTIDAASLASGYEFPSILTRGFVSMTLVTPGNFKDNLIRSENRPQELAQFCESLSKYYQKYSWPEDPCGKIEWQANLRTRNGHPLIYAAFGNGPQTTLVLGGVHPNELTPIPMAFRFAHLLAAGGGGVNLSGVRVIVAPIVNPDGFMRAKPLRTNETGIDVNRNFFTMDWYGRALSWWHTGEKKRDHFPGYFPNSEIETLFQIRLIDDFSPDKIISIHAPLGFLDYDGPGDRQLGTLTAHETRARGLVYEMAKKSNHYRVADYSFYPGSLGNFAGNERNIPTVTLELETTNPHKVNAYWTQFLPGLVDAVQYSFRRQVENKDTPPPFSSHYSEMEKTHDKKL